MNYVNKIMVTFRNNNTRRNNFRRNERTFKVNGDRNKYSNNFSTNDTLKRVLFFKDVTNN